MQGSSIFMPRFFAIIFLFGVVTARAQFAYTLDQSVQVLKADDTPLAMPWAGGLNSAQVNTMHLDGDNKPDLVIFDRAGGRVFTYLNKNDHYEYSPDYEDLFPELGQWLLLRDLNCDGRKDLFTSSPFGVSVFVNTTAPGGPPTWRPFNPGSPLLTIGVSGNSINLKVNETDIPAIDDVDGDGDLDVLNFRFVGTGTIEFHENVGSCDSMQLKLKTQRYGGVTECSCGRFAFNDQPCPPTPGGGKTSHVGGKSLMTIDTDNDGDRELLFSEESCATLYMITNAGTNTVPSFQSAELYPSGTPASFRMFPSAYYEDVDFNGVADLLVSPNIYSRLTGVAVVKESVWFYRNTGTVSQPSFSLQQTNFLQDEMIDIGDFSTPAFFDGDGDGDEDMFIGKYGNDDNFLGSIICYENIGTISEPKFKLNTDNVAGLEALFHYNFKPFFADMNADGTTDLAWTSTSLTNGLTALQYLPNKAGKGLDISPLDYFATTFRIGQPEQIHPVDVNLDGKMDLLVGRSNGALQYYENRGETPGRFDQMLRVSDAFLGIGTSTSRQNPAVATGDLDGDGNHDLLLGDQRGRLSIYSDYRNYDPADEEPSTDLIYNSISTNTINKNLGARLWPAVANLFGSTKPAIILGNSLGGIQILKNTDGTALDVEPVVTVSPNPLDRGQPLVIKSDRNVFVQIFSILGQKMSELSFVPGGQLFPLALNNMATGMYIARFTYGSQSISVKFVLR